MYLFLHIELVIMNTVYTEGHNQEIAILKYILKINIKGNTI